MLGVAQLTINSGNTTLTQLIDLRYSGDIANPGSSVFGQIHPSPLEICFHIGSGWGRQGPLTIFHAETYRFYSIV